MILFSTETKFFWIFINYIVYMFILNVYYEIILLFILEHSNIVSQW